MDGVTWPVGFKFACLRVDLELHDGVALLVGDVKPLPARVDGEAAWKTDALRRETDQRERAGRGIDPIADDAVVAAVGGIEELAGRMDRDLGCAVRSVVPGRLGRDGLQFLADLPSGGIVGK